MAPDIPVVDKRTEWQGPVPEPAGITSAFWEGSINGKFLIQECSECGNRQFYPRVVCTECGQLEPDWIESNGKGTIYSYTVCHAAREEVFQELLPYVVAIVQLEEGPQLTALVPSDSEDIEVGTSVEMRLWRVSDEAALPVFHPT